MGSRFGAALSFYTLFSLIPLLFLVVAVVGFVSSDSQLTPTPAQQEAAQAVDGDLCSDASVGDIDGQPANPLDRALLQAEDVVGTDVADQLARLTCQAATNSAGFLGIGIALAAFSGSAIFLHLQGILNHIFHTPQEATTGIVNTLVQRGIALGWALLLAVLVFIPLAAVGAIELIQGWIPADLAWLRSAIGVGVPLVSLVVLVAVVAMTFQVFVRVHIPWRAAWRGGLFTAVAALLGAFGVGTYLGSGLAGGALGALGGVAILLFFFNLIWMIYLFGAEVTKVYADYLEHGDIQAPAERREAEREALLRRADLASRRTPDSAGRTGLVAFAVGLVAGWIARRGD